VTLRLDYLSPLPPVRSGISDYSVDLLPELAARADVRVLRLPDQEVAPELEARWRPGPAERAGEDGRLPLYQMGNNRYHEAVWRLALERPGVVVLHDLVLHHFLLDRTVGRDRFEPYREQLERDHGWIGRAAAAPVRWGAFGQAAQFELPASRTLLRRQRGVVVHGRWAATVLGEEDGELAVRVVPMAIPLPAAASREAGLAFRRAHGIPERAPLIGSFGFQTPIKRTDAAIRALARPGLEAVRLLIAGELSPYANYLDLAVELGVGERVHVTGFLPFEELESAIAATDLCLNLRYPTAGETSASLLRILAVGRPVLVSSHADYGDLPREVALEVPLGEGEDEALAARLAERLLGGADELRRMGEAARRFIAERHDPGRAAEAMVAAVTELARLAPPGDRAASPPPPSSAVHARGDGTIEVEGLEGWRAGERRRLAVTIANRGVERWRASRDVPGGVCFEVQLWARGRDRHLGRPWLTLDRALEPGESRRFALDLRRPLAGDGGRLLVKPTVTLAEGNRPFGGWHLEVEL
jgi:glycosyltransferase involved in cell wall biosynthesis